MIAQEKEYYQKEAEIIQQKQELERQFRHDLNNRLQILNDIAECGNISELKNYLSEIDTRQKKHNIYSNTGNLIIDSIINSKLQDASEKEIKVNADIILPAHIEISTDDMVIILGNLLDNAIEACEKVDADKYIDILMRYENGCIFLNIKNSFNHVINRAGDEFITLKKDKTLHGLGIKSVKNTIETYNGIIEFSSKSNEFSVDIILYL
ncbi:MAG: GHKL domain-containing protein [Lachnospiraceae bacterium]|nr:GHKL domain-containing protein [Lachnospiraceae bacterium]